MNTPEPHSIAGGPTRPRAGRCLCRVPLLVLLVIGLMSGRAADAPAVPAGFSKEFIRFTKTGSGEGHVDTAVKSYFREGDRALVTLAAVIHVGDAAYYEKLQKLFESYDSVLYEMIRDRDAEPASEVGTDHPVSQMQIMMKTLLGLEFQLDRIDYGRTNFVHADLDPESFARLQADRGETIFGLLFRAAMEEQRRQSANPEEGLNPFALLLAFTAEDSAHQLKFLLGQQMGQMENLLAGLDQSAGGEGSVILSGRNDHAMKVLSEELQKGRKKLVLFYGAGHMPDFEKRLLKQGFKLVTEHWNVAWDIRKKNAPPAVVPTTRP
ncbi:MAG TPA: hypothetical protein DCY13_04075 [Verrucomicrobiales bacterium]|nr:hypothetical protein [Verrucomicrobiales bacterium]